MNPPPMTRYRLRPVQPSERSTIYEWRNEPAVRRVMSNPGIVDQEVHKDWWQTATADPGRRMLMLEDGGVPTALILFFELKPGVSAKWGFYTAPAIDSGAKAMAAWVTVEVVAIAYAFDHLRLQSLYCETLETNSAVLLLHERIGFEDTGQILAGFVSKVFTRESYELRRAGPLFGQLGDVAIETDLRDVHVAQAGAQAASAGDPKRAAILGSANWELAARDLAATYRNAVGCPLEVTTPPFAQYALDLADAGSALRRNPPDILIFAERFEDLAGAEGFREYLE